MRLKGQVAVVTGGRRGIGYAVAEALGLEGCRVVIVSRSPLVRRSADRLRRGGIEVRPVVADASDERSVRALASWCRKEFGRVDILVNCAGVQGLGTIQNVSLRQWDRVLRNNLTTVFLCSKYLFPLLVRGGGGRIVNISSIAGRSRSRLAGVHYTASKAGILGFTRQLAVEAAPRGIRVNAVAPSQTDTQMLRGALARAGVSPGNIAKGIPLGVLARPEQIASVCLFLCLDSSSYMTGAVVDVNGGQL